MSKKFLMVLLAATLALPLLAGAPLRRVFITRHGQQPGEKINGDISLTELGFEQATLLGKYLKKKNFKGKIYASPYLRCVQTAVMIAREVGCKVYPDARFQERVGDHRKGRDIPNTPNIKKGYSLAMYRELFPNDIADDAVLADDWPLTEPEDYNTTQAARIMNGVADVLEAQPKGDVLIVSHAGGVRGYAVGFTAAGCKGAKGSGHNCCLFTYGVMKNGKFPRFSVKNGKLCCDNANGQYSFINYTMEYIPENKITSNFKYKNNPEAEKAFKASKGYKDKKSKKSKKAKKSEE